LLGVAVVSGAHLRRLVRVAGQVRRNTAAAAVPVQAEAERLRVRRRM